MLLTRLLAVFIVTAILGACSGGGGSKTSISTPIPGGSATTTLTITKTSLTSNNTTTIKANFMDSGRPIQGLVVNFSASPHLAFFNPLSGQAITDATGTAIVQMTATNSTGVGQVTVSANINGKIVTQTAPFYLNTPQLQLANLTYNNSVTIGGSLVVSADLLDSDGNLYTDQNVDVYFNANSGYFMTDNSVGKIRSSAGRVSATYYSYGSTNEKYVDTISVTFGASSLTGYITVNPLTSVNIGYLGSLPTKTGLNYKETISFTFRVTNSKGAAVSGQAVDFAISGVAAGSTLLATSSVTELDGTVTAVLKAGSTNTTLWVTATLRGVGSQSESPVLFIAPAASNIATVSPTSPAALDFNQTMAISFKVTDISGLIPVPNQAVTFTITDLTGEVSTVAGLQNTSVITDLNGIASTTLVSGIDSGTIIVKGSIANGRSAQTAVITVKTLTATKIALVSPTATTNIGYNTNSSTITFKVMDDAGVVVPNTSVYFNVVDSTGIAFPNTMVRLENYGALSDANGLVTTILQTKTTPMSVYVGASFSQDIGVSTYPLTYSKPFIISGGLASTLSLQATNLSIASWTGTTAGTIGSLIVGTPNSSTVTARMTDALGIPAPDGTLITFTTTGGSFTTNSCITASGACNVTWNNTTPIALDGKAVITATGSELTQNETIIMASVQPIVSTTCASIPQGVGNTPRDTNCTVTISDLMGNTMANATTVKFTVVANAPALIDSLSIISPVTKTFTFPNSNAESATVVPVVIRNGGDAISGSLQVEVTSNGVISTYAYPLTN